MRIEKPAQRIAYFLFLLSLAAAGAFFLKVVGIAALEQVVNYQFYADSATYHRLASGEFGDNNSLASMLSLSGNLLGPLLILKITQQNYYAVLCLNILLFWIAVELISRATSVTRSLLYILLLTNPITISSLLAVNKEILSLFALALLLYGLAKTHWPALLLALAVGVLVRWQFFVFAVAIMFVYSPLNLLRNKRLIFLTGLLILASIIVWQLDSRIYSVRNFGFSELGYEGSGLYDSLIKAQRHGLYWLVFIPKTLHLLFGLGLRLDRLFDPVNLYNDVWQLLHSTTLLIVFSLLLIRRQFRLDSDLVFISMIYLVIFVLSPIYVPRYFYPVYILWAILLANPDSQAQRFAALLQVKFFAKRPKAASHESKGGAQCPV